MSHTSISDGAEEAHLRASAVGGPQPRRPERYDAVHAQILCFYPELVAELGGDARAPMHSAGLSPSPDHSPSPAATYRQMVDLLERTATALDCPDFGMRLAKRQAASMLGPLGHAMKNSRTFGEALDYVSKHIYAHSLAARVWIAPFPKHKAVFAGHDILLDRIPNKAQAIEQVLLTGHITAMEITGGHSRARRVHFRHHPVSPLSTYRRNFGCDVRFGQNEDGVTYFESDLAAPIVNPDAHAFDAITKFIDAQFTRHRPPLHAQVRGYILQHLNSDLCSNAHVANMLNMHARTMHRRLHSEGTSFQQIKDEVRRDIMLYYLQHTSFDFSLISERLGFAEQSVMSRSCNRWFATSPTQLRAAARETAPR